MMPTLLFLDISFGEIFIIVAVIFIIFGPQKIPEIARKVGKGMREIKKASSEIKREIHQEANNYKTDLDLERIVNESDLPDDKKQSAKPQADIKEIDKKV
ncbi:MAG: twin-arginine translocase TatA/TatE family subunit [Bacteroidales bacterium]|nr:twin-arginine translocase TatA/TatE family subunit [Bacteroidales bacterium]